MKRKKKRHPAAKLFDPEAIKAIGGEVTSDGDFLIFEGNRYSRKGFLYKNFFINAIMTEGVKPTLIELEKFEDVLEGLDTELTLSNKDNLANSQTLCSGDNVEVCAGELINLQGKVLSTDGDTVLIMPKHENLNVSNDWKILIHIGILCAFLFYFIFVCYISSSKNVLVY